MSSVTFLFKCFISHEDYGRMLSCLVAFHFSSGRNISFLKASNSHISGSRNLKEFLNTETFPALLKILHQVYNLPVFKISQYLACITEVTKDTYNLQTHKTFQGTSNDTAVTGDCWEEETTALLIDHKSLGNLLQIALIKKYFPVLLSQQFRNEHFQCNLVLLSRL